MNAFESCDLPEFACDETLQKVSRIENSDWNSLAVDYCTAKEQVKFLENQMHEIKKKLIEIANKDICVGGGIELHKITKKGNVDYSKIPELDFVDLEQYRKPETEYWKISEV